MFVITGGGSGIGRALAIALAKRKKAVLIIGREEKKLTQTAAHSSLIKILSADVSTDEGLNKIYSYLEGYPKIDALVNNAGIIEPIQPLKEIQRSDWQQLMATNVDAPLFLTQKLYDKLREGRVLNIGSGAAYFPVVGWGAYCVSKAALSMLTQAWIIESKDVAFANVMPGIIDTEMQAMIRFAKDMSEEKQTFFKDLKKENKLISPETVACFLSWLLLDLSVEDYLNESKDWDIYDKSHHSFWLKPPFIVPTLES